MTLILEVVEALLDRVKNQFLQKLEDLGMTAQKAFVYLGFFLVLWMLYASYFKATLDAAVYQHEHGELPFTLSLWNVLKFTIVEGWPFAVVAFFYRSWNSADAARVAFVAFVAAEILWCNRLGLNYCPLGLVLMLPLLAAAAIGHVLGVWRRNASKRLTSSSLPRSTVARR
jgi:hypothetical protein